MITSSYLVHVRDNSKLSAELYTEWPTLNQISSQRCSWLSVNLFVRKFYHDLICLTYITLLWWYHYVWWLERGKPAPSQKATLCIVSIVPIRAWWNQPYWNTSITDCTQQIWQLNWTRAFSISIVWSVSLILKHPRCVSEASLVEDEASLK